jgi:hypothetical protein
MCIRDRDDIVDDRDPTAPVNNPNDDDQPDVGDIGGQSGDMPTGSNNPNLDMYNEDLDELDDYGLGS